MNLCILHVGTPKTGTSSIQETLYHELSDPSFRYFGFGEVNGCRGMATLFGNPKGYFYHNQKGLTESDLSGYRRRWQGRLDKALSECAYKNQTLIISSENAWIFKKEKLEGFRRYMEDRGYRVKVIFYMRPWKRYIESAFSQRILVQQREFTVFPKNKDTLDYRQRIETIDSVFGRENVTALKYDPKHLTGGCVVKDFLHRFDIKIDPTRIRRSNDSQSLSAIRLLYTYRSHGPDPRPGMKSLVSEWILIRCLSRLKGPSLRFHSSVVEGFIAQREEQRPWLEDRLGVDFREDVFSADASECIRDESDMFKYDPASLEWLSEQTGKGTSEDPKDVAAKMHYLRLNPRMQDVTKLTNEGFDRIAAIVKQGHRRLFRMT